MLPDNDGFRPHLDLPDAKSKWTKCRLDLPDDVNAKTKRTLQDKAMQDGLTQELLRKAIGVKEASDLNYTKDLSSGLRTTSRATALIQP